MHFFFFIDLKFFLVFIFKSSQYTRGDYVFVLVLPAADICSRDNFQTTFQIFFIFGRIDGTDL